MNDFYRRVKLKAHFRDNTKVKVQSQNKTLEKL